MPRRQSGRRCARSGPVIGLRPLAGWHGLGEQALGGGIVDADANAACRGQGASCQTWAWPVKTSAAEVPCANAWSALAATIT